MELENLSFSIVICVVCFEAWCKLLHKRWNRTWEGVWISTSVHTQKKYMHLLCIILVAEFLSILTTGSEEGNNEKWCRSSRKLESFSLLSNKRVYFLNRLVLSFSQVETVMKKVACKVVSHHFVLSFSSV